MKGTRSEESILDVRRHKNGFCGRQAGGITENLKCTGCEHLNWTEVSLTGSRGESRELV
jgi:hypothetical protein